DKATLKRRLKRWQNFVLQN
ncbi:putative ribosomal-protein-serine acetyltransferase, partial [Vibrio parahaemolyticus V-223/04]